MIKKLGKDGVHEIWKNVFGLVQLVTGNVDVKNKGTLQRQIDNMTITINECFGETDPNGGIKFADGITADNFVDAINEVFQLGNEKKNRLVENLVANGVPASTDETWESLLDKVLGLTNTSGDTVTAETLLSGYTAHDAAGDLVNGIMADNGVWIGETTGNGKVLIPRGFHAGEGYVDGSGAYNKGISDADARANTDSANYKTGYNAGVTATKVGTAAAGNVLTGKTFTNASSVGAAGTMADKGGQPLMRGQYPRMAPTHTCQYRQTHITARAASLGRKMAIFKYIEGSTPGSGLTGQVKIPDGYGLLMGIMANGLLGSENAYQAGTVYWDGNTYITRNFAHITVNYNPDTNIFSGTSSTAASTSAKNWQLYIAPKSYFNN